MTKQEIEQSHGRSIWELLGELAAAGHTVASAGRALDYNVNSLFALLNRNPDRNPFPVRHRKPVEYVLDTGEPFRDAVQRLAPDHTLFSASFELGYTNVTHFKHDLARYGITATFRCRRGEFELDGIVATPYRHALRRGMCPRTVHARISRWGLCARVFDEPVASEFGPRRASC